MRIVAVLYAEVWHAGAQFRMINSAVRTLKLVRLDLEIFDILRRIGFSLLIAIIHKTGSCQLDLQRLSCNAKPHAAVCRTPIATVAVSAAHVTLLYEAQRVAARRWQARPRLVKKIATNVLVCICFTLEADACHFRQHMRLTAIRVPVLQELLLSKLSSLHLLNSHRGWDCPRILHFKTASLYLRVVITSSCLVQETNVVKLLDCASTANRTPHHRWCERLLDSVRLHNRSLTLLARLDLDFEVFLADLAHDDR